MVKVSIITINLNNKAGLKKTIESVISQTYSNLEYIIIDGNSKDGSLDIIKQYKNKIDYWVSEPDKGIYNAMNKGILKSGGDYLLFLNSGDWLVSSETIKTVFHQPIFEEIIYGNVLKVTDNTKTIQDKGFQRSNLTLADMVISTICHQATFIKGSLFKIYGLYSEEYKLVSDWCFLLKVIGLGSCTTRYIDLDISFVDMHGISSSRDGTLIQERSRELMRVLPKNIYTDYINLKKIRKEAHIFNKIKNQPFLWLIIRLYNKLFSANLWN